MGTRLLWSARQDAKGANEAATVVANSVVEDDEDKGGEGACDDGREDP